MYGRPVAGLVAERARNTLLLAVAALALALLAGVPLGVVSGSRRGIAAGAIRAASLAAVSMPTLVSSLVLVLVAARTGWLPTGGMTSADAAAGARLAGGRRRPRPAHDPADARHRPAARGDHRAAAVAGDGRDDGGAVRHRRRGERRAAGAGVLWRHVLKPSLRPVAAIFGLVFGNLLSGSFVVEIVTSWPGLGRLMFDALRSRDLYLVAGCAAAGGVFLALGALVSDAALAAIDPRLRGRQEVALVRRAGLALVACVALLGRAGARARAEPARTSAFPTARSRRRCRFASIDADGRLARAVRLSHPPRRQAGAAVRGGPGAPRPDRVVLARRRGAGERRADAGRGCRWAPTDRAATCSRASSTARGCRWPSRSPPRSARCSSARSSAARPGAAGGVADEVLMRLSDFVVVLPAMYVVLSLRAALPLVLPPAQVFALVAGILALVGWPIVARGVRAIVAAERERDYAQAALALGAGRARLLLRHLLPAARGFLAAQAALLVAAFILAEATLSYVGLGFPDPSVSWGVMLQEAANVSAMADAPWTLAPAAGIFLLVLGVNLAAPPTTLRS